MWIFIICGKHRKQSLNTVLNALKTASKKVVHKTAEATGKFKGNKIVDKIVRPKHIIGENPRIVEEMIIPPEKREEILNELSQVV